MEWDRSDNQVEVSLEHHTVLIVLDGQFLLKVLCTDVAAVLEQIALKVLVMGLTAKPYRTEAGQYLRRSCWG